VRELATGVRHWTARHAGIGLDVSSYWLVDERVVLDPMVPPDGLEALADDPPRSLVLTNRHHLRHAARYVEAFGCRVHAARVGMHEFGPHDPPVEPFDFDSEPVPGVRALEVDAICPDETAIHVPRAAALAVADGVINRARRDRPPRLRFVSDRLLGDDPEAVKAGLRSAYSRLLDLPFERLLLAHGEPVVRDAKGALKTFLDRG
jgi:hypothetical protein